MKNSTRLTNNIIPVLWLIPALLKLLTLITYGEEAIKVMPLDSLNVTKLLVSREHLTTIAFPSPISDLQGLYLAAEPEPPALFQIAFRPGSQIFSVRALSTNCTTQLVVGWRKRVFVLQLVESNDGWTSVLFNEPPKPQAKAQPPPKPSEPSLPERLRDMLAACRLLKNLTNGIPPILQHSRQVKDGHDIVYPTHRVSLNEVVDFPTEDTLAFGITLENRTDSPLEYIPESVAPKFMGRLLMPSLSDATGLLPPGKEVKVWVLVTGGINGVPRNLSLTQFYPIGLELRQPPLPTVSVPKTFSKRTLSTR